jgi:hypothetical protein
MSLSNPRAGQNPANKFIEWAGSEGFFQYWDKEAAKKILMPKKFHIIVLDQLNCITGFHKNEEQSIYSNEVRSLKNEPLRVRHGRGQTLIDGLYDAVKDTTEAKGGKFTKSVYAVLITSNGKDKPPTLELINIKFWGSALGPWIDANIGDTGHVIELGKHSEQLQKGTNLYWIPTVKISDLRPDVIELAKEIDRELQIYLKQRGSYQSEEELKEPDFPKDEYINDGIGETAECMNSDGDADDLPF